MSKQGITVRRRCAALLPAAFLAAAASAQDGTWLNPVDGTFSDSANWEGGVVPGRYRDATFGRNPGGPFAVTTNGEYVDELNIRNQRIVLIPGADGMNAAHVCVAFGPDDAAYLEVRGPGFSMNRSVSVGYPERSHAALVFSGPQTAVTGIDRLDIGGYGEGVLRIENGAVVECRHAHIGDTLTPESVGRAVVTGQASTLRMWGDFRLLVGLLGKSSLEVSDGGVIDATVLVWGNSELLGDGLVRGLVAIQDGSTARPGRGPGSIGVLTADSWTVENDATLEVELSALQRCDRIDATNSVDLRKGSALAIKPVDGYEPAPGDSFELIRCAHLRKTFTGLRGADLGGGRSVLLNYAETGLTITVDTVAGLTVIAPPEVPLRAHAQAAALADLERGGHTDATWSALWSIDDPSLARSTDKGVITGLRPGRTNVRAAFAEHEAAAPILILDPSVIGTRCPADFNRDGKLNINDFIAFQAAFRAADPRADFNKDGKLNISDFIAYQAAFRAGC